jgi:hypothetical protein
VFSPALDTSSRRRAPASLRAVADDQQAAMSMGINVSSIFASPGALLDWYPPSVG